MDDSARDTGPLRSILDELQSLEPLFPAACRDATPELFERLVAPGFWEIGASGRRYARAFVLEVLRARQKSRPSEEEWRTEDFAVSEVGGGNYLLSYTLTQPGRVTRRVTLWRRDGERWQAVFHQGTVITDQ